MPKRENEIDPIKDTLVLFYKIKGATKNFIPPQTSLDFDILLLNSRDST